VGTRRRRVVSDGEIASADLESFLGALRDGTTTFRLPEGESPVALKRGEFVAVLCPDVILKEPRRVTQGVYGGSRVRLAKTLSFNLGAFRAAPHEKLHDVDRGTPVLTNKRYAFMGEKRTVSAILSQIVSIEPYRDAVAIHRANKLRLAVYCSLDRYGFPFAWQGRTHEAILTGRVVACAFESLIAESEATPVVRRPASAARTTAAEPRSAVDELERLAKLRDSGALSDEEFAKLNGKIIDG
jgi:hypothetical protein